MTDNGSESAFRSDMTTTELREWHRRKCEEEDGWSHLFPNLHSRFGLVHDGEGQIASVKFETTDYALREKFRKLFDLEVWRKAGNALSQSPSLTEVRLSGCGLTAESIAALFGGEQWDRGGNPTLENIQLNYDDFGAPGLTALLPLLKSQSTLKFLGLTGTNLGDDGAYLLAEALEHVRIEELDLRCNDIGNDGMDRILSASNSIHLADLSLLRNRFGVDPICNFLGRAGTKLRDLFLGCDVEEHAKRMVDSISGDSRLQSLIPLGRWNDNWDDNGTSNEFVSSVKTLVCGNLELASSFESICNSQHYLYSLGEGYTGDVVERDSDVKEAFYINARLEQGASVAKRLRCKLRTFFFKGDFDVQPFVEMDAKIMPHLLELVTRTEICVGRDDEEGAAEDNLMWVEDKPDKCGEYYEVGSRDLSGVYRIVRNCHIPHLFSFPSPDVEVKQLRAQTAVLNAKTKELAVEIGALKAENAWQKRRIEQLTMGVEGSSRSGEKRPSKKQVL